MVIIKIAFLLQKNLTNINWENKKNCSFRLKTTNV